MTITDRMLVAAQAADMPYQRLEPAWRPVPAAQLRRLLQAAFDHAEQATTCICC